MRGRRRDAGPPEGDGSKGARENGVGRSGGGLAGKVLAMAGAPGHPVDIVALPDRAHDPRGPPEPMGAGLPARPSATGPSTRTGPSGNRKKVRGYGEGVYGWRRWTGNRFVRIRDFRAVVTRCERTKPGFRATFPAAAAVIAVR